jgi:hypothetical protein
LFAGTTIPSNAVDGSLRHTLLERREAYGIPLVTQSYNGIHLSAGPLEAMVELQRFDSDHSDGPDSAPYTDYAFGKRLEQAMGVIPDELVHNKKLEVDGKKISVFDLTEDVDTEEAVKLLKRYFKS